MSSLNIYIFYCLKLYYMLQKIHKVYIKTNHLRLLIYSKFMTNKIKIMDKAQYFYEILNLHVNIILGHIYHIFSPSTYRSSPHQAKALKLLGLTTRWTTTTCYINSLSLSIVNHKYLTIKGKHMTKKRLFNQFQTQRQQQSEGRRQWVFEKSKQQTRPQ